MSPDDISSLRDIYKDLSTSQSTDDTTPPLTKYIHQFIWRDMSSKFDLIGPYFTSAAPMTGFETNICFWKVVEVLQHHDLTTMMA